MSRRYGALPLTRKPKPEPGPGPSLVPGVDCLVQLVFALAVQAFH